MIIVLVENVASSEYANKFSFMEKGWSSCHLYWIVDDVVNNFSLPHVFLSKNTGAFKSIKSP